MAWLFGLELLYFKWLQSMIGLVLYRKFYKILRIQIPLINVEEFRYKQEAVKFGYDIQFIKNSRAKWRKEQFVFDNLRTGTQTFLLPRYEMDHESID